MSIKVAEFVTRLEFGGVEAMLLNYTTHFRYSKLMHFHTFHMVLHFYICFCRFSAPCIFL